MEAPMKINGDRVRALREQKSWSQEHLASASGLSVRTVQRVEVDGIASAETRLALAAALDVPVADLMPAAPPTQATLADDRQRPIAAAGLKAAEGALMRRTLIGLGLALALALILLVVLNALSGFLPRSPG
jgi:transcriptional regulator with XRE-family HTH domain